VGTGAYPGSFNPPTIAHLAIAHAARHQAELERLDLVVSRVALGKPQPPGPALDDRLAVLRRVARRHGWLGVRLTDSQLLVDIAAGYDVLVVGADKWAQVLDPRWYASEAARDRAVASLPAVLVVPRRGVTLPPLGDRVRLLEIDPAHLDVSSSLARATRPEWMLPEAAEHGRRTGHWSGSAPDGRPSSGPGASGRPADAPSGAPTGTTVTPMPSASEPS